MIGRFLKVQCDVYAHQFHNVEPFAVSVITEYTTEGGGRTFEHCSLKVSVQMAGTGYLYVLWSSPFEATFWDPWPFVDKWYVSSGVPEC